MHFRKLTPKVISYRDFIKFENERFMGSLHLPLSSQNIDYTKNPDIFFKICQNELNHHAPRKEKYNCGNNKPFLTKVLPKSITERTRFRNKFGSRLAYTRQRNFCVSFVKKDKKNAIFS